MKRPVATTMAIVLLIAAFPALMLASDDTPTLKAGTTLHLKLTTALSSKTNENGDPFTAEVEEPVFGGGEEMIPAGSTVEGRISFVKPPGRAKGKAEMRLTPEKVITSKGLQFVVSAALEDAQGGGSAKLSDEEGTLQGPGKSNKQTAKEAGIGAGAGAGVGAIAGGGTGALYGMGIGAAAAIAHTVFKKHGQVVLPQGTDLTYVVSRDTIGQKASTEGAPLVIHQDRN
jgi:hypothetical protein